VQRLLETKSDRYKRNANRKQSFFKENSPNSIYLMNNLTRTNEVTRADCPTDFQTCRRKCFSCTADSQRALPHVRQCCHTNMLSIFIECNPFVDFIGYTNNVMFLTKICNIFEFVESENLEECFLNKSKKNEWASELETLPRGLFGVLTMIRRVRELNRDSSSVWSRIQSELDETFRWSDSDF